LRDIVVAVLATGISQTLKNDINDRLVEAISVVPFTGFIRAYRAKRINLEAFGRSENHQA
jgi:hypothetical protein